MSLTTIRVSEADFNPGEEIERLIESSPEAGGLLIGAALAWTSANPELPPAVRLFVITGFLGGLTTFSTFSAEAFSLITSGAFIRAGVHMASHLLLSLTGTWAGWTAVRSL